MKELQDAIELAKHTQTEVIVCERSFLTDFFVFYKLQEQSFNAVQRQTYTEVFKAMTSHLHMDLFLYLKCQPEVCAQRIFQRGRPEEMSISFEYLSDLHRVHEQLKDTTVELQTFCVDSSKPEDILQEVLHFLDTFF